MSVFEYKKMCLNNNDYRNIKKIVKFILGWHKGEDLYI